MKNMSNTNISGVFHLETKDKSVSKKNMVVKEGVEQLFNWFKMSDYLGEVKHQAGEKLFSFQNIERINWKNSVVSVDNNTDETIKNSFSNIQAMVDSWDNTFAHSNYSNSSGRFFKVTFKDKKDTPDIKYDPVEIDLRGVAIYGKKVSNYSSYSTYYCGKIILKRKFSETIIAKKIFEVPVLISPTYMSSDKLTTDKNNKYWQGGKYYVYFTFDEMFGNEKDWSFYDIKKNETLEKETVKTLDLSGFQNSATLEKPYLEKIYEIEFSDFYNSTIQINELDFYTYRKNCVYNSPSFFEIGGKLSEVVEEESSSTSGSEEESVSYEDTGLSNSIAKIPVDEIYRTEDGKLRYVGYIPEDEYDNTEINEIGLFFEQDNTEKDNTEKDNTEQDNKEKMFAKTVLAEPFTVPEGSFVRIMYELEVE